MFFTTVKNNNSDSGRGTSNKETLGGTPAEASAQAGVHTESRHVDSLRPSQSPLWGTEQCW